MAGHMTPSTGQRHQAIPIHDPDDFAAAFHVSPETLERLAVYERLLRQWQKTINLVAPSTLDSIWHRHFADSAQLLALAPTAATWVDLGSGAGFPGLVVAILMAQGRAANALLPLGRRACPGLDPGWPEGPDEGAFASPRKSGPSPVRPNDLRPLPGDTSASESSEPAAVSRGLTSSPPRGEATRVTLIESNARKCAFLREVVRETGIAACVTVDILSTRIEAAATQASLHEPDVVSARALAPLDKLVNLAAPLSPPRTVGLFLKGRDAAKELKAAEKMWNFNVELVPSRTDPDARVVVIRNLQPKTKAKE
jgi:16S rRNA G527 N7-methylase RsmG